MDGRLDQRADSLLGPLVRGAAWHLSVQRFFVCAAALGAAAVAVGLEWERIDRLVAGLDPADDRLLAYRKLAQVL